VSARDDGAAAETVGRASQLRSALIQLCSAWLARDVGGFGNASGEARTNELIRCINDHSEGMPPVTWYGLSDAFRERQAAPSPSSTGAPNHHARDALERAAGLLKAAAVFGEIPESLREEIGEWLADTTESESAPAEGER
jgi:hypothetical protein